MNHPAELVQGQLMSQATAAQTSERRAQLLPSPSITLTRPEQQRQQQRAAEQAVHMQDVSALQRAIGSPTATLAEGEAGVAGPAAAVGSGDAVGGLLSSTVLQAILGTADVPGQQPEIELGAPLAQQSQHASCKSGASPKASPPLGSSGLVPPGTGPAALAAYIASLQGSSNTLHRQLHAGGGGGSHALPARGARNASGRRELFVLARWLEVETQRFNATHSRRDERTPLVDFLMLGAARARAIYGQAYAELARHVSQQCEERGRLMADVWIGYASMLDG